MRLHLSLHLNLKKQYIFALLTIIYVGLFCYLGFYVTPSADDYDNARMAARYGLWQIQYPWYAIWSSSPIPTFMVTIPAWLNFKGLFLVPMITCVFNLFALCSLIHVVRKELSAWNKLSAAFLLQAAWFAAVPGLNENFYWLCAMSYTWIATIMLFTSALIAAFVKKGFSGFTLGLACAASLFISSMFMPQVTPFLCAVFISMAAAQFVSGKRKAALYCAAAFFIALAGLLVMYMAPGTVHRMASTGAADKDILRTLLVAAVFGGITALKFFTKPIIYVLLLFLPDLIAKNGALSCEECQKKSSGSSGVSMLKGKLRGWHIFALVALIAPLEQAICGWALGGGLPVRAEGLVIWIMAATWLSLWAFGCDNDAFIRKIRELRAYKLRTALLALCLVLNSNFLSLIQDLRLAPLYAAEYRQREASLAAQKNDGETYIVVPALTVKPALLYFSDIRPSPHDWKNQCFAKYWRVPSVSAMPAPLANDGQAVRDFREGRLSAMEKLADAGDSEVQFMLGEIYDTTFAPADSVPKDNAAAAKWYTMAAERGHAHACRRLVRLYALGMGVPKNYFYALTWLLRSQVQGRAPGPVSPTGV